MHPSAQLRKSSIAGDSALARKFFRYFSVRLADTQDLRDEVYRIRYQVYCQEFGYEPAENFPEEKEYDEFDMRSTHCLVYHKDSGHSVGCVRLVPTDPSDPQAFLPFERHCGPTLTPKHRETMHKLSRLTFCEISRVAVLRTFRRRAKESATQYGAVAEAVFSESEKRVFPYIAISLFLAATVLTELTERRNVFAMMEPTLPRLLKRVGIVFEQVGSMMDYHGQRAPYFITTDSALKSMVPEFRGLYEIIRENLVADFEASM